MSAWNTAQFDPRHSAMHSFGIPLMTPNPDMESLLEPSVYHTITGLSWITVVIQAGDQFSLVPIGIVYGWSKQYSVTMTGVLTLQMWRLSGPSSATEGADGTGVLQGHVHQPFKTC